MSRELVFSACFASSAFDRRRFRSRSCPPILKNRDCSTLVGRSHWLVASVENVLVTVNGQLLLKML